MEDNFHQQSDQEQLVDVNGFDYPTWVVEGARGFANNEEDLEKWVKRAMRNMSRIKRLFGGITKAQAVAIVLRTERAWDNRTQASLNEPTRIMPTGITRANPEPEVTQTDAELDDMQLEQDLITELTSIYGEAYAMVIIERAKRGVVLLEEARRRAVIADPKQPGRGFSMRGGMALSILRRKEQSGGPEES